MKSGRWVWVEFPDPCKGDELPDSYYSITPGPAVYCRLFARGIRDDLLDWIARNPSVEPPMKLRKPKLEAWIEARMCEQKALAAGQGRGYNPEHSRHDIFPAIPGFAHSRALQPEKEETAALGFD